MWWRAYRWDTQQSNLNTGEWCGRFHIIIFILAASAINVIHHIIHSLGHTTQQSNYTALCVIMGIPSSFLRYTTVNYSRGEWLWIYHHTCNQYDEYTRADGDTTHKQQSNIMILYDRYREHNARTQGGAEEEVIGGMAGHFTWGRRRRHTIKNRCNWQCRSLRHEHDDASGHHG